jgi:hypothetical protein
VTAVAPGDTHVVAFYDNGVAAVSAMIPFGARLRDRYPELPAPTPIDRFVNAKLRLLGIVPSELCGDAEFLRRASLDLTGTLPLPDEIEKFLADADAGKRARKIEELLTRPAYSAYWANKLSDITGNSRSQQGEGPISRELSVQWFDWLRRRIADNVPYDRLAEAMVLATSRREGQTYEEYASAMSACFRDERPADFTDWPSLPQFWIKENLKTPSDRALAFAHAFLGIRLQCAECHKHPFDQWTQEDFRELANQFAGVTYGLAPDARQDYARLATAVGEKPNDRQGTRISRELLARAQAGETLPLRELYVDSARVDRSAIQSPRLAALGEEHARLPDGADPRRAVMNWLRRADQPYFARALVNRVWANYFDRGLVDPTDDLSAANPPSHAELLDYLVREFVAQGYDLRWLHREITASFAYQRSWRPNATNAQDLRNLSRAVPRRLPAEVVYDALAQATAGDDQQVNVRNDTSRRAVGHLSLILSGTYAMDVFGKPERSVACDCERSAEPSLLQAVFLQNDPWIHLRLGESAWLAAIGRREANGDVSLAEREAYVRQAYLRTVSRIPDDGELARGLEHLAASDTVRRGVEDLLWALLNSKEFILNH